MSNKFVIKDTTSDTFYVGVREFKSDISESTLFKLKTSAERIMKGIYADYINIMHVIDGCEVIGDGEYGMQVKGHVFDLEVVEVSIQPVNNS